MVVFSQYQISNLALISLVPTITPSQGFNAGVTLNVSGPIAPGTSTSFDLSHFNLQSGQTVGVGIIAADSPGVSATAGNFFDYENNNQSGNYLYICAGGDASKLTASFNGYGGPTPNKCS